MERVGQCFSCWRDGAACSARKKALLKKATMQYEQRLQARMLQLLQQHATVQVGFLGCC